MREVPGDVLKAMICRRFGALPGAVGEQDYAEMMRVWAYVRKADALDAEAMNRKTYD